MRWNDGYFNQVDYTHGYYKELSPAIIDFALLNRRLVRGSTGPLRYLELGFGQGLSLNIHAAGTPGEFWGTDYSAQQATNARSLAREAGSPVQILDDSFAQLLERPGVPEFDIIALHGIWSWVSDDVRRQILEVLDRKLANGGAVFLSYNCRPGWSGIMSMQRLFALQADMLGEGPVKQRIDTSLDFLEELAEAGGRFFSTNPTVRELARSLKGKDARYVAHEYLQEHLQAYNHVEVAKAVASARLHFGAPALLIDHIHGVHFTPAGGRIMARITDSMMRETVRDYLVNSQFRCDVFVKGAVQLSPYAQRERLAATPLVIAMPPEDVKLEISGGLGTITLKPDIYNPILNLLATRGGERTTLGDLGRHKDLAGLPIEHILEAVTVLMGLGAIAPRQSDEAIAAARPRAKALNRVLRSRAQNTDEGMVLASPVSGTGVGVPQVFQYFMAAEDAGHTKKDDVIEFVHKLLRRDDPMRPGPQAPRDAQLIESLGKDLVTYRARLPVYRALELV